MLAVDDKSFPPDAWGLTVAEFLATAPPVSRFATPLLTLDHAAMSHNVRVMSAWVASHGLHLAPHGKTTMAPALWEMLTDAGAWGLTLATAWQAQVARSVGIGRLMVANAIVDPVALRWLAAELSAHADVEISCWVDSLATVRVMEAVLREAGVPRPIPVIVELGAPGGRTGARSRAEAVEVARAVAASDVLTVAGVGGYEGALAHDRAPSSVARVDAYLDDVRGLHEEVAAAGLYRPGVPPIVTVGGSAYFDRVAERLAPVADEAEVVLRSGAFQIHDDGFYAQISPMGMLPDTKAFRSAMHAWVRVVSHPEPGLVLLDGGKRDLSFDEGLPVPQRIVGLSAADSDRALAGSEITALNDQHGFLRLFPDALAAGAAEALPVGAVVRLGLSHPCTALDRWRRIPVVADANEDDPRVIDVVETRF